MTELSSYEAYRETQLFKGLDGLRFLSILAVVWHHSPNRTGVLSAERFGFLGVDLFFVISGFLIVTLLLREKEESGEISLRAFYMRRSLRIFPLYYGFLLALTVWYATLGGNSARSSVFFDDLPFYLFYVANWSPVGLGFLWSLAAEEQFYIVWPFLEKTLKRALYPVLAIFILVNLFVAFWRIAIADFLDMPHLAHLEIMQATFTPILLGVCLAHLLHTQSGFSWVERIVRSVYAGPFWLLALIGYCFAMPEDISGGPRTIVHLLMVALVGSVVIRTDGKLIPALDWAPVVRVGAVSYGIYIFHPHCLTAGERVVRLLGFPFPFGEFLIGFAISIIVAEASYRLYESPFLKLKARFSVVGQRHA